MGFLLPLGAHSRILRCPDVTTTPSPSPNFIFFPISSLSSCLASPSYTDWIEVLTPEVALQILFSSPFHSTQHHELQLSLPWLLELTLSWVWFLERFFSGDSLNVCFPLSPVQSSLLYFLLSVSCLGPYNYNLCFCLQPSSLSQTPHIMI